MDINISSFLSMSCIDGDGVRSVFFVQGCPLKCAYCHNPETQAFSKNITFSVDSIIEMMSKYRNYYGKDGGITISGGEPLYQIDAVTEIFRRCKEELGITTCLETSGVYPAEAKDKLDALIGLSDKIYCDYKFIPQQKNPLFTNEGIIKTENFLKKCHNEKTVVRTVVIPNINNNQTYIDCLVKKIRSLGLFNIELLPFKKTCIFKYRELNREFPLWETREATQEEVLLLQNLVNSYSQGF